MQPTLFAPADCAAVLERLAGLAPGAERRWGKMDAAQMLAHCALALETATGERPMRQKLIGRVLAPFVRETWLGEKPFQKGSPTNPTLVVSGARDHEIERARTQRLVLRFVERASEAAARETHGFFGRLTGAEWGVLMHKHLDHHLRQFGA